jgi:hypothetical protein
MMIRGTQNSFGMRNRRTLGAAGSIPSVSWVPRPLAARSSLLRLKTLELAVFSAVGAILHERAYDVICNRACKEP